MPIIIARNLDAKEKSDDQLFTVGDQQASKQDIRPLRVLVLNLMPAKIITEQQFARLLGNTPLQVVMELLTVSGRLPKHTPLRHMFAFYETFEEVKDNFYDGMIITGAPVEQMPFEDVDYWDELCAIMEWSKRHVHSTLHVCWGAQAGLYYHYGIGKKELPQKLSGVYPHHVVKSSPLFRGFDDVFQVPHSRYTTVDPNAVAANPALEILAESEEAGLYAASTRDGRQVFITGHIEYDPDTLKQEYLRDQAAGKNPQIPQHYFPGDDPSKEPVCTWRASANLLFANWLNYFVYQKTPYQPEAIAEEEMDVGVAR